MHSIYINGIGVILPGVTDIKDLWQELAEEANNKAVKIESIPSFISSRKIRRMDRLSILALYSFCKAYEELKEQDIDSLRVGTVFNSDFGSLNTIAEFAECLVEGSNIEASPVTFANTVINACLGHICMEYGVKGASTMLLGSNYVGYAMKMIRNGRSDMVFAGGFEEYNEELFDCFNEKSINVREGFSTLLLSKEKKEDSYCEIVSYSEGNLGGHPCFLDDFSPDKKSIINTVNNLLKKAEIEACDIDGVITASNNRLFIDAELEAVNSIISKDKFILPTKVILGDTLGSALGINIATASMILKYQIIPCKHLSDIETKTGEIKYLLVNNFDISGNYVSFILKKCD
ncbi:hypothetical protein F8154_10725 [Alkaliphilus pronyensis]|uniref:Beta-ketoacyl synthase-like N-terminal domain-containing protein n=1 Tax=Alkaliphilus pronyensis TaxID=1482732 RepID=A0A6I0FE49_9FIRM|nr:beta-ketoacyl synthase N-terminal-like domain-containing protein [Alkaliphilus pronyensis]KAB3533467.1 hypothetical protein F8154_10725 [Alkaliphilus pronyensis]